MKLIVAVDKEWGIGYKGDLLIRVKGDLQYFKQFTLGKTVIYGSNTLATFPGGKPLPKRNNILLHPDPAYTVEGALVLHSIDEFLNYAETHSEEEFVVIGGASVYRQLLPFCDTALVTKFDGNFPKDVYFENLDRDPAWALAEESETMCTDPETDTVAGLSYKFTVYKRKTSEK